MKIAIVGGSGLIGRTLAEELKKRGDYLLLVSRNSENSKTKLPFYNEYFTWNYNSAELLQKKINSFDVVINLAGAPIGSKRWTKKYQKEIRNSRVVVTELISKAICDCKEKPKLFISSSAIGYYGNVKNDVLDENSKAGSDFLAKICAEWENASKIVEKENIKLAVIRTGVVLANEGGALKKMLLPFKLFVGGPLGSGKQWFPWIHIKDEIKSILFIIDNKDITGPVNLVAPNQITMNEFAKALGKVLNRPSIFKVPTFLLRIVVGKAAENIVASQKAKPAKLLNNGFMFNFKTIEDTLNDLLK
ncbi:MAG: TIGR01777 family protein [Ignavibacteriales bacterium CG12_big_fil_rev_8_21_14_0_65_30_8]|nr:MAG: TIGR01777 family protein [Ignavibacteriales bacterium CG12_big_fil_rev_8_21_14_0_65_30_8]